MITSYTITSAAWTAITSAGESATAWLDEEGSGTKGTANVRITHSTTGTPAASVVNNARKLHKPSGNIDVMTLYPDSSDDIFYARCPKSGDQAIIQVDAS